MIRRSKGVSDKGSSRIFDITRFRGILGPSGDRFRDLRAEGFRMRPLPKTNGHFNLIVEKKIGGGAFLLLVIGGLSFPSQNENRPPM